MLGKPLKCFDFLSKFDSCALVRTDAKLPDPFTKLWSFDLSSIFTLYVVTFQSPAKTGLLRRRKIIWRFKAQGKLQKTQATPLCEITIGY